MDYDPFGKALSSAHKKTELIKTSPSRYMLSALLAGAYLTIVVFVYWTLKQIYGIDPAGRVLSSMFFGVGLSIIIFTNTELFTSNNMYLTMSTLSRQSTVFETVRLWVMCWVGNFIGAAVIAALLYAACATTLPADHALLQGVHHKMEMPAHEIFFKGILANWVVCLAVWINLNLKEEVARLFSIIFVVFIFLFLGFEHSIANMGAFSIALFADPTLPVEGIAHNLLWSTLGNIVGGSVGIGATAWALNKQAVAK